MVFNRVKKSVEDEGGSTMVEMAILYPLIIAAIMALIYLLINIYSAASLQSSLHTHVRIESSTKNELTEVTIDDLIVHDKYRIKAESMFIDLMEHRDYIYAEKVRDYRGNALVEDSVERKEYGRSYVIDEASYYRKFR